jgi:hypothetical protein
LESQQEQQQSGKYHRNKIDHRQLCDLFHSTLVDFVSMEHPEEIDHDMDAQVNEALKNIISWIAPRNNTCSGSRARISMVVGIHSLGYE